MVPMYWLFQPLESRRSEVFQRSDMWQMSRVLVYQVLVCTRSMRRFRCVDLADQENDGKIERKYPPTQVRDGLMGVTRHVQLLVTHLRRECAAVAASCTRAATAVDNARRQLRVAFLIHQEACRLGACSACWPPSFGPLRILAGVHSLRGSVVSRSSST